MDRLQLIGSQTAKDGFKNEKDIADKFNNSQNDSDSQQWLKIMNYKINEIENVVAIVIHGHKSDINTQIKITLKSAINIENIQVKLVSNPKGFNQIDKRAIEKYKSVLNWNIPDKIMNILKRFTGELTPSIDNPRDKRRMFIDEFNENEQKSLLEFFENNKSLIVNDVLRGRGEFAAEWVLVAQKIDTNSRWVLKNINEVIQYYNGPVRISPKGSLLLGKILLQRKGGTPDPTSLQFKINPAELFDI